MAFMAIEPIIAAVAGGAGEAGAAAGAGAAEGVAAAEGGGVAAKFGQQALRMTAMHAAGGHHVGRRAGLMGGAVHAMTGPGMGGTAASAFQSIMQPAQFSARA